MPKKQRIAIITYDSGSAAVYAQNLRQFFGEHFEIDTYSVDNGSANHIAQADLNLISTCAYAEYSDVYEFLPLGGEAVIIQVTVFKEQLHRLFALPRGTRAMLVNINAHMATETMAFLNRMGVNNIEFMPYYPGAPLPPCTTAVTPGECRYVPPHVAEVLDIGPRVLSPDTLIEAALKLQCEHLLEKQEFKKYVSLVVDNSYNFQKLFNRTLQFEGLFEIFQNISDLGIIGVDNEGTIFAFNPKAEYVTGLKAPDIIGCKAAAALPYLPFAQCFKEEKELKSLLIKIDGTDVNTTLTPVIRKGHLLGAFAVVQKFTDAEYKQYKMRMQLMNKGFTTKYTFADIVATGSTLQNTVAEAKKLAKGRSPIVITGESGTGKELFAQAIHAASERQAYPFVAVNCANIPEHLAESELFGYEEGAFPGAKPGGKKGLFEYANRGTLFLDEISAMSHALQGKLLRVLQEGEILPVGGSKMLPVNVRILAASATEPEALCTAGTLRRDLYYRLAVLHLRLPPLRTCREEILPLMEAYKRKLGAAFTIGKAAKKQLLHYGWPGNIRELQNCVEYLAFHEQKTVEVSTLPPPIQHAIAPVPTNSPPFHTGKLLEEFWATTGKYGAEHQFILEKLAHPAPADQSWGRKSLSAAACASGYPMSEQEVRSMVGRLEKLGLVKTGRGRGGTKITALGKHFYYHVLTQQR